MPEEEKDKFIKRADSALEHLNKLKKTLKKDIKKIQDHLDSHRDVPGLYSMLSVPTHKANLPASSRKSRPRRRTRRFT